MSMPGNCKGSPAGCGEALPVGPLHANDFAVAAGIEGDLGVVLERFGGDKRQFVEIAERRHGAQLTIGEVGGELLFLCETHGGRLERALEVGPVDVAAGWITLIGNINNPDLLLSGAPEQVAAACRDTIAAGVQILSPECAVPLRTPVDNLRALVAVAEEKI